MFYLTINRLWVYIIKSNKNLKYASSHILLFFVWKKKMALMRENNVGKHTIFFAIFKDESSCFRIGEQYNHDKNNDHNLRMAFLQWKNFIICHQLSHGQIMTYWNSWMRLKIFRSHFIFINDSNVWKKKSFVTNNKINDTNIHFLQSLFIK